MNEPELNKKLAEWAGFQKSGDGVGWWYPAGLAKVIQLPNFTQSLDTCFKWLVPKLQIAIYSYLFEMSNKKFLACVMNGDGYADSLGETPTLALCLAIEKLIDGENR